MKPFNRLTKFVIFFPYYIIHSNIFFGLIFKILFKKFYYKKLIINLNVKNLKLSQYSSFLFKTYELNDRILIEKHINNKNKSVIIGAGLGFIPILTFKKSRNKVMLFEIDKEICDNLTKNLIQNDVSYELHKKNLSIKKEKVEEGFYYKTNNFLANSLYSKEGKKEKFENININQINSFNSYNTLIIDAEGAEEYYINNINILKNIKYLFFELHYDLISKKKIDEIFKRLKFFNFIQRDKCFNSYYFVRK
tara:strand:- start:72 stop:821 length:750 start_codon:yes stop_codon:yes gene_type:complete